MLLLAVTFWLPVAVVKMTCVWQFNSVFVFIILCNVAPDLAYLIDNNPYRHIEVLDPVGKYQLSWLVDWKKERVIFNVTVQTRGYVGLGLSKDGRMKGADIVLGGIAPNGRHYLTDRHAIENSFPVLDNSQDWVVHSAWESGSHTSMMFSRAFDTCDKHDIPITDDTVYIIWSYGETDNLTEYHFQNRGSFSVYLLDPDLTPGFVQDYSRRSSHLNEIDDPNVWTVTSRLRIPAKRTTYWCNFHKISLDRKHHIIGYNFRINQESRANVHHLILFRCNVPPNINPASVFEPFLRHRGEECYSPTDQLGILPTRFCTEISYGNAIGGRSLFYPEHAGLPIGVVPNEYYLLQIHYDNPALSSEIVADIRIHIFYTPNLRAYDASVLSIGHHIPGTPSLIIPPRSVNHLVYGHCSLGCTSRMLPPEGIKIISGLLHAHNAGRGVRIQHFRNNRELPWILNDDNYQFTYQPNRLLKKEVVVLPGDQITVRCVYDTSSKNTTTVGAYATEQEMCKTFLIYYNKLANCPICRSEIVSSDFNNRYLGIGNMTWDQSQLENVALSPPLVAGFTVSQVSDTFVNWNPQLRTELQRDHLLFPQVSICPDSSALTAQQGLVPELVSYPVQATPYQPPQRCLNS